MMKQDVHDAFGVTNEEAQAEIARRLRPPFQRSPTVWRFRSRPRQP